MAPKKLKNCSFKNDENGVCHKKNFVRKIGLKVPTSDEKYLLSLRSGIPIGNVKDICLHHEQTLLKRFSKDIKWCCDPFASPLHGNRLGKKTITLQEYETVKDELSDIVPGVKVCVNCYLDIKKIKKSVRGKVNVQSKLVEQNVGPSTSSSEPPSDATVDSGDKNPDLSLVELNDILQAANETPVKTGGLNVRQRVAKAEYKMDRFSTKLKRKFEQGLEVKLPEDNTDGKKRKLSGEGDLVLYENIMSQLKNRFNSCASYADKLTILTLSPFGITRTMEEFGASNYLVKQSRKLRASSGVLGRPQTASKGRVLTAEVKAKIAQFYENDDFSRIMPGKKQCLSIRNSDSGEKEARQKRLLLCNLRELYAKFKEDYEAYRVGFSSFAALRPPWCILAGPKGTHSVCVCSYHQNAVLMAAAFPHDADLDIKGLMAKTVCTLDSEPCMMRTCQKCPGVDGIIKDEEILNLFDFDENIQYKKWVSTDRTELLTITDSVNDFLETLGNKILSLTRHHYTAKSQSNYLKHLKHNLKCDEVILLGDFAENYSFIVQDAVQGFHWMNTQATLHPFVAYYRKSDNDTELQHHSFCVISNATEHSTAAVFCFQSNVVPLLKTLIPELSKIIYFSDGCAGQYKNKNNFINLCFHNEDFPGILAEWHFFATSHGKSPCDGIGGVVKWKVARSSLQRPLDNQILTPKDMFHFCIQNIKNIQFLYVTQDEIAQVAQKLQQRFASSVTIKGTQRFHCFIPFSKTHINVSNLSENEEKVLVRVALQTDVQEDDQILEAEVYKTGAFVACTYNAKLWFGVIEDVSEEFGDYHIKFMHQKQTGTTVFWPAKEDRCWIKEDDMLCTVECPILKAGRIYSLKHEDLKKSERKFVEKK